MYVFSVFIYDHVAIFLFNLWIYIKYLFIFIVVCRSKAGYNFYKRRNLLCYCIYTKYATHFRDTITLANGYSKQKFSQRKLEITKKKKIKIKIIMELCQKSEQFTCFFLFLLLIFLWFSTSSFALIHKNLFKLSHFQDR